MRVLVAGATGAIGRPLIRGLKQHGHSVFGFARSAGSTRVLTEMGAEAVIGDALDAASVPAAALHSGGDEGCGGTRQHGPEARKRQPSRRHAPMRCTPLRLAIFGILV